MSDAQELSLWVRAKKGKDAPARDQLILYYWPMVAALASLVYRSIRAQAEFDDLKSEGTIGLINAVDNFDYLRGNKFKTYAGTRINGAMYDYIRRSSDHSRSDLRKARLLKNATLQLSLSEAETPSDEELALHLGFTLEQFIKWRRSIPEMVAKLSLDEPLLGIDQSDKPARLQDVIAGPTIDVLGELFEEEVYGYITAAVSQLPHPHDKIVAGHLSGKHYHELTHIADVSVSRISQIVRRSLPLVVEMAAAAVHYGIMPGLRARRRAPVLA